MSDHTESRIISPYAMGKYFLECETYNNGLLFDTNFILDSNQGNRFQIFIKARKETVDISKRKDHKYLKDSVVLDGLVIYPYKTKWNISGKLEFYEDNGSDFRYHFDSQDEEFEGISNSKGLVFKHREVINFDDWGDPDVTL